jgi:hypothetical protein
MPNQKVPQLPILTAITDADLFYVVDVSDTTDDPTGSSKQVTREEILTNVSYVEFNTTATTTHAEGRVHWNNDLKTLEVDTENPNVHVTVGQELISRVNNQTGGTLLKGRAVYINGQQGQRPTVTYATYTADTTSAGVVGLIADDINNNNNGYIISYGLLEGIDTSAYSAGTPLYLYTGGTITDVKPQAPFHDVRIGKVINSNATVGSIFVNIQNGYELDELHDVRITSPTTNDVLVYSSYNGSPVWVNTKTLSGLTYVGATTISATTISGGTFYGDGTNLTGVLKGGGTANYLPKWTGTTGLGNSIIQDNGTNIGVGNIPNAQYKMIVYGGNLNSIYGYATFPGKYGVVGSNVGDDAGTYVGGYFASSPADTPINTNIYIGAYLYANADAGGFAYGAQIQDGTQGLNKVLISATADGKTNWSSNLTGLTSVSATTISGGTMVITSTPTTDNTNTQLLSRDPSSGNVELVDISSLQVSFNYGLANAIMTGTFLT